MKILKSLILLCLIACINISCFEDNNDNLNPATASEINDFVWKAMNVWYLYKEETPNLANNRFSSDQEYADYLNSFSNAEDLFESLIYQRQVIDKFSWITSDYIANEQLLNGITTSNGMRFGTFSIIPENSNRYGIVLYVLPNTSAETQGVKRGDIFYGINDTQLTTSNIGSLISQNTYSINLGDYDTNATPETTDDSVTSTGESISLIKSQNTANPIFKTNIIPVNGEKVGYLMYNGFNGSSSELNDVFGNFKSEGITDLVLDLRYNPGGFNSKAVLLASLITGQFTGDVMNINQYNPEIQAVFENQDPEILNSRFINNEDGMTLNSLNLDKVYVLTTRSSASASELVINSLKPYMSSLIQIGSNTAGKYQGSRTLYDSEAPNFFREGVNPSHTYALQPLIFKFSNINGNTDFIDGLSPDIPIRESINNFGVLGDQNEPLLAAALAEIENSLGRSSNTKANEQLEVNIKYYLQNGLLINDIEIPEKILKTIK